MKVETPDLQSQERRSARFWSFFLLALMAINLLVALIAMVIAIGDPSFQPIPSYGGRAVDWETHRQLQARSDALGWHAQLARTERGDGIRLTLTDTLGNRVSGATGTVQAYHFTRAGQSVTVPWAESAEDPGRYFAELDVAKDGRWQVAVKLSRGETETFLWEQQVEWYR